ncbi:hypothetical protein D024_0217 [Vibrio parahaemolyticus 3259]|nr:hypothetical protein D024_0217 [Vibrio parahaemolyticus 3259]
MPCATKYISVKPLMPECIANRNKNGSGFLVNDLLNNSSEFSCKA